MPPIATISVLLSGLAIVLIGIGLLGTLLGVRATLEDFGSGAIGLIMSGYYAGYILGTYFGPGIIQRVGHIRAFAAFAALAAATSLGFGLLLHPAAWLLLRIINGAAVVGVYMVVESWLNEQSVGVTRGRVFATYMMTTLLALAFGQYLLLVYAPVRFEPFALVAVLVILGLVPIAVTRLSEPRLDLAKPLPLRELFRLSPLGAVGAFAAGMANGAFWGMTAVFAHRIGLSNVAIATLMSATILGGALLQWPIGHFSDKHDRRYVLILVSALSGLVALAAALIVQWQLTGLPLIGFIYGGLMFSIYGLSVAHANDQLDRAHALEATRGLLLLYGFGALAGPLLGGLSMQVFGAVALPVYSAVILLSLALYGLYRTTRRSAPPTEEQTEFVPLVRTTPVVLEMHPEADVTEKS